MKKRNKFCLMITVLCLMLFFPVMNSLAADGSLTFSQTEIMGSVGEDITVDLRIAENNGGVLGDIDATLSYDTSLLEYVSASTDVPDVATVTGGDGTVSLTARGTGAQTEYNVQVVFHMLAEGSTSITSQIGQAWLYNDDTLNLQQGAATVTIQAENMPTTATPGDGTVQTGAADIEINGQYYAVYENFSEALIPEGFSASTLQYGGASHNAVTQDVSGIQFAFLVTGMEDPVMAMYDEAAGKFVLAAQVEMKKEESLFILGEADGSVLPEQFAATTLSLNGLIFPAWQNMSSMDYYVVYGISYKGTKGFYQYDSQEETYQRYIIPAVQEPEAAEEELDDSLVGTVRTFVNDHFLIVLISAAVLLLLLFILLIVLGVKLGHRNAELDDVYDELDEIKKHKAQKKVPQKKPALRQQKYQEEDQEDTYDDDGYEDDSDEEEDFSDSSFRDEDPDDDYNDHDDDYDDYDDDYDDDHDDGYEDDPDEEDDLDEDDDFDEDDVEEYIPRKKRPSKKDFDIDFIDL